MKQRNIQVRAVLRDPPDLKLLARALIQLQIELEAKRQREEARAACRQASK
jgi:hypothetical protein